MHAAGTGRGAGHRVGVTAGSAPCVRHVCHAVPVPLPCGAAAAAVCHKAPSTSSATAASFLTRPPPCHTLCPPLHLLRRPLPPPRALPELAVASSPAATAAVASTFNQLLAVFLGWAVLIGSCFRSLPQIIKMVRANSAEGLSMTSIATESLCYTVTIAYNINHGYAFNTFGDTVACWLQDLIIFALMLRPLGLPPLTLAAGSVAFSGAAAFLFCGGVSREVLDALQWSNVIFSLLGVKLPQIALNIRRGNTGMLSRTTGVLNVLGNLVRVYTTLVLTGDLLILGTYVVMLLLNGLLLQQTLASAGAAKAAAAAAAATATAGPEGATNGTATAALPPSKGPEEQQQAEGGGGPAVVFAPT